MMGVCVARSGPGAGRNSVGPRKGVWMKVVVPTGWRRARGLVATVHRVGGVRGLGRKPVVKLLVSCFCKASLVWRRQEGERWEVREEHSEGRTLWLGKHMVLIYTQRGIHSYTLLNTCLLHSIDMHIRWRLGLQYGHTSAYFSQEKG